MNIVLKIIFLVGGCVELISIIACADLFGILLNKKIDRRRIIPALIIFVGISVFALTLKNSFGKMVGLIAMALYFFRFILAIYVLYKQIDCKIFYITFFCELSISLVGTSLSSVLANMIGKNTNEVSSLLKLFVQLIILLIIIVIRKKTDSKRNLSALSIIPRYIFILIISAVIFLSALSSLISFSTDNIVIKNNILTMVVIILTIVFICIIASLLLNVIAKQHFTTLSQMMEKQVELQISHYNEVEKMNYEINRFRHDYSNHLQSILSLVQMGECSMAEEYILKLKKVKSEPAATLFYTGNRLADAILTNKSSLLDEGSRIEYSGIMPLSVDNVDLCVILSNSLDNAIEACHELQKPCMISMFAKEQQGYFIMSIKNPTLCSESFYDIPVTTKSEKEHHGMGLRNIESVVKKYDGQMKIKCENGFFELVITMKI